MASDFDELAGAIRFEPRPRPLPSRLSPSRRIALLLLCIEKCWGRRATRLQLDVLDTALVDPMTRKALIAETSPESLALIRHDPALTHAIDRAIGFGLVEIASGNRFALTQRGAAVAGLVRSSGALSTEQQSLGELPGRLTQGRVDEVFRSDRWL